MYNKTQYDFNKLLSPSFSKTLEHNYINDLPESVFPIDIFKVDVRNYLDQFKDFPIPTKQFVDNHITLRQITENQIQNRNLNINGLNKKPLTTHENKTKSISKKFGFKKR